MHNCGAEFNTYHLQTLVAKTMGQVACFSPPNQQPTSSLYVVPHNGSSNTTGDLLLLDLRNTQWSRNLPSSAAVQHFPADSSIFTTKLDTSMQ
jgi:hypothetical protein